MYVHCFCAVTSWSAEPESIESDFQPAAASFRVSETVLRLLTVSVCSTLQGHPEGCCSTPSVTRARERCDWPSRCHVRRLLVMKAAWARGVSGSILALVTCQEVSVARLERGGVTAQRTVR
ncbi:hypothetical protein EYF80_039222 [Liparis tanakae]|uniref:Uncharacterized protein n=1 Tax=Liparis tanakae TaxID=230148 RepID=A0A4Z2GD48_9TELE|nr:hypothetical protein EYF80_039222 [Liparis tanakae]